MPFGEQCCPPLRSTDTVQLSPPLFCLKEHRGPSRLSDYILSRFLRVTQLVSETSLTITQLYTPYSHTLSLLFSTSGSDFFILIFFDNHHLQNFNIRVTLTPDLRHPSLSVLTGPTAYQVSLTWSQLE